MTPAAYPYAYGRGYRRFVILSKVLYMKNVVTHTRCWLETACNSYNTIAQSTTSQSYFGYRREPNINNTSCCIRTWERVHVMHELALPACWSRKNRGTVQRPG